MITTPSRPADDEQALDEASLVCTETPDKLDAEAAKTGELLGEGGVPDETTVTVLQHLRASIPANAPVMNCAQMLATYIRLRAPNAP